MESASTRQKQAETVSQEKGAAKENKKDPTFARQWFQYMKWLFINTALAVNAFEVVYMSTGAGKLFSSMDKNGTLVLALSFIFFPFLATFITAALSTYLHFINKEKEVKEEDKRLAFIKHFLAKWIPTLLTTALTMYATYNYYEKEIFWPTSLGNKFKNVCLTFIFPLSFACLLIAPIATYLIRYIKLPFNDTIKSKKTVEKAGLHYFLIQWASYSSYMFIHSVIARIIIFLAIDLWELFNVSKKIYRLISPPIVVILSIVTLNAWRSYTSEKGKMPSEQKPFKKHLLRHYVPALLVLACNTAFIYLSVFKDKPQWQWAKKLYWSTYKGDNTNLSMIYPALVCCFILAPIIALIEMYNFKGNRKKVQRGSSKKSREEAKIEA